MDCRILTYNFRGLTTPKERVKVHFFLKGLPKPIDVMCGLEHKIRSENLGWLQSVWPEANFISTPVHDGVHARRNRRVRAGRGGVFLAIGPTLKQYVPCKGITNSGKVV